MQTDVSTDLWLIYGGSAEHGVMRELGLGLCTITIDRAGPTRIHPPGLLKAYVGHLGPMSGAVGLRL